MPDGNTIPTESYAALSPGAKLVPHRIERRKPGQRDVQIDIDFCGICHTDIHFVNNDWGRSNYPMVPGHEIVGHVSALGPYVSDLTIGQRVAVGYMVDSCHACSHLSGST